MHEMPCCVGVFPLCRRGLGEQGVEYVVCLIAELLAPDWTSPWARGHDWAPWNLEHVSGARIEIQQSAARQRWHVGQFAGKKSSWFGIVSPDGYWTIDGSWIALPGGVA